MSKYALMALIAFLALVGWYHPASASQNNNACIAAAAVKSPVSPQFYSLMTTSTTQGYDVKKTVALLYDHAYAATCDQGDSMCGAAGGMTCHLGIQSDSYMTATDGFRVECSAFKDFACAGDGQTCINLVPASAPRAYLMAALQPTARNYGAVCRAMNRHNKVTAIALQNLNTSYH